MYFAIGVEPTNEIALTSGCASSASTASLSPCTTLNTPSGNPASLNSSASRIAVEGTFSDGFSTNVLPHAIATGIHPHRHHRRKIERRDAGAHAERLAQRMAVDAGADFLAVFALHEMRYAHREFDDFEPALHRAGGIGQRLAVLLRNQVREFVLVARRAARGNASACARGAAAASRASRESGLRRLHGRVDVGIVAEWHAPDDLPRRRIGHVSRARARSPAVCGRLPTAAVSAFRSVGLFMISISLVLFINAIAARAHKAPGMSCLPVRACRARRSSRAHPADSNAPVRAAEPAARRAAMRVSSA